MKMKYLVLGSMVLFNNAAHAVFDPFSWTAAVVAFVKAKAALCVATKTGCVITGFVAGGTTIGGVALYYNWPDIKNRFSQTDREKINKITARDWRQKYEDEKQAREALEIMLANKNVELKNKETADAHLYNLCQECIRIYDQRGIDATLLNESEKAFYEMLRAVEVASYSEKVRA